MGDSRELRDQERDRLFRDMQRQRDDALATLARLADEHKREMAEVTGLLDERRQAWRRQRLALNDCRSWLLGRLDGVSGADVRASIEKALGTVVSGETKENAAR